jgi:hypothetical protein
VNEYKNCVAECSRSDLSVCAEINLWLFKNVVDIWNGVWTNQLFDLELANGRVIMNLKVSLPISQYSCVVCQTGTAPHTPWESLRGTRHCLWSCLRCLDQEPSYLNHMEWSQVVAKWQTGCLSRCTDAQQTKKQRVFNIQCKRGRCYNGETGRPLEGCIKENKYNLTEGLPEKSKLSQHGVRRRPQIMLERREGLAEWSEHHVLEITRNPPACLWLCNPMSQPSLNIPPISALIIAAEVRKIQLPPL